MTANGLELQQLEDLEELAAYIDGHLPEERRRAVEERLARDPRFYEVFTETVRFQQGQEEPTDEATPAARFPFWRGVAAAAAAAIVLAAGLALWFQQGPESAFTVASTLDAEAVAGSSGEWGEPGWRITRSAEAIAGALSAEEAAVRIGVLTLNLEAHLQINDDLGALRASGRLKNLANSPHTEAIGPQLVAPHTKLQRGEPVDAQALGAEIESLLPSAEMQAAYAAGSWLALGRIAASAGQADLLQRGELRELLSTLAVSASTPEARKAAAQAGALLAAKSLSPQQLKELEELLQDLLILLGGSRLP